MKSVDKTFLLSLVLSFCLSTSLLLHILFMFECSFHGQYVVFLGGRGCWKQRAVLNGALSFLPVVSHLVDKYRMKLVDDCQHLEFLLVLRLCRMDNRKDIHRVKTATIAQKGSIFELNPSWGNFGKRRLMKQKLAVAVAGVMFLITQCWADQEGRKALSKNNARGLTTLKQRCKKYVRDYKFDTMLADYRQVR